MRNGTLEHPAVHEVALGETEDMERGRLRVYLGPAPGAGKTYRMLEEAQRRLGRGTDVVVAVVNTHGRSRTIERLAGLEVLASGATSDPPKGPGELDVEAVLERHPAVVLVDDLAHVNPPGARHGARWEDVEEILAAGIDVISTLDVQQLESVKDVVERITGVTQLDVVPDAFVRRAQQVELVDITPEALRRRMAHGNVYGAEDVDATLANYFRPGTLTALRELALLWLAEGLEESLRHYAHEHRDGSRVFETRERLVVGVSGDQGDEALLRRSARMASRVGAELVAVHVVGTGDRGRVDTSSVRALAASFDASFQEIVDDDVASALVAFARSEHGTQIVLGTRRRSSARWRGRSVVSRVLRASDLDVHVVAIDAPRPVSVRRRRRRQLTWRRRLSALAGAAVVLPALTIVLTQLHSSATLSMVFPCYLLAVIGLTIWGGAAVGILSALAASFLENFYFIEPTHSFSVTRAEDVVALSSFLVFSIGASFVVTEFTRRSNEAERARAEAEVLATAAASIATSDDLLPVLDSLRAIFDLSGAALVRRVGDLWENQLVSGTMSNSAASTNRFEIDDDHALVLSGPPLDTQDRHVVAAFASRVSAGLHSQRVQQEATALRALAEADALRTGLLRAVSHDLRTPLATIEANVSSLLQPDVSWSHEDEQSFLTSIEREVHRLTRLVTNLLDAGRLEAGVVTPRSIEVDLDDVVASALETIDTQGRELEINLPGDLPTLHTDPDLLERVIANLVANACRFSPADQPVRIRAGVAPGSVDLLIIDRGIGVRDDEREAILAPFQRLNDEGSGAGLGLTVASGFTALLGGELRFEATPGGGLTVVIALRDEGAT